jgi:hypothetical protein
MAIRQMGATTNNRRLKRKNQIVDLEARLSQFPATLAAAERRKQQEATAKFREDQLAQERAAQRQSQKQHKDTLRFQREAAQKTMGLEAAKLGTTVMSSDIGMDFGKKGTVGKQPFDASADHKALSAGGGPKSEGFFSGMNVGGGLQGALGGAGLGWGLANMFGKGKTSKWLGAGLGALGGFTLGSGLLSGSLFNV